MIRSKIRSTLVNGEWFPMKTAPKDGTTIYIELDHDYYKISSAKWVQFKQSNDKLIQGMWFFGNGILHYSESCLSWCHVP